MAGSCQHSKPQESLRGKEGGAKGHVWMGSALPRRLSPWFLLLLPSVDSDKKACGWRQLCKQKASRRAGRALGPNPASFTQGRLLRGLCVQLLLGSSEQCGHDSQQRWLRPSGSRITEPQGPAVLQPLYKHRQPEGHVGVSGSRVGPRLASQRLPGDAHACLGTMLGPVSPWVGQSLEGSSGRDGWIEKMASILGPGLHRQEV